MTVWLLLALGGGAGALARYGLSARVSRLAGTRFPWGTLVVNLTGAFLLGLIVTGLAASPIEMQLGALLAVGFLGDFTTFSTLSYEAVILARQGRRVGAVVYLLASALLGLAAFACGLGLGVVLG